MPSFDLSIVVPTCNRGRLLELCLGAIHRYTRCNYEVIVVDGASDDDTPAVLAAAAECWGYRLRVIRERRRQGFVKAANKGFRAASGRTMLWLNDDARPAPGALDRAVQLITKAPGDVGQMAFYHPWHSPKNIAYRIARGRQEYHLLHVRGTLYANFGIARMETWKRLDYFDEQYYLNAADPDFSLKCWNAGLKVVPADGCIIDHDEHADDRRAADAGAGRGDNDKLFAKWLLPPKADHNDFDPLRPCTLRGLRQVTGEAA